MLGGDTGDTQKSDDGDYEAAECLYMALCVSVDLFSDYLNSNVFMLGLFI